MSRQDRFIQFCEFDKVDPEVQNFHDSELSWFRTSLTQNFPNSELP
jgi:hypothetical protein